MKICSNCNLGYPDNTYACPNCGNTNLYSDSRPYMGPSAQPRQSNLIFGQYFKTFFKSPIQAKHMVADRKDYGTAFIVDGIALFIYFLFGIFFEVGLTIRYHARFDAVIAFVYPLVFFIIVFGLQYVNVLLYYVYSKRRVQPKPQVPGSIFIYLSTGRLFSSMIIAFAALVSIGSPILGTIIASVTLVCLLVYTGIQSKLEFGVKPESFLDSFMFILMGVGFYILGFLLVMLLLYASARSMATSSLDYYFW